MSIQDEARAAADEYARHHIGGMQPVETLGDRVRAAFEAGAVWRDEQPDREPSDAEVEAAKAVLDSVEYADEPQAIRAALIAAQEVRDVS
ncbi:MAG: hypothetical protein ACTH32_06400 [Microbacterium gubbeenense]|uniref:hypothetical protein n=1 Tax=Microbacterium gubbeenense TaxID=159896 RepID=UPI003F94FEF5